MHFLDKTYEIIKITQINCYFVFASLFSIILNWFTETLFYGDDSSCLYLKF